MQSIVVGQRWVSHTEPSLGLGLVESVEGRRVEIFFPAAEESRHYAVDNAPISRVVYSEGDPVSDREQRAFQVVEAMELRGLMIYLCEDSNGQSHQLTELMLNPYVQFSAPDKRLLNGHLDDDTNYQLRIETLEHRHQLQQNPVRGLLGARVELLPHQLYIASEVARRFAPRVLLADEVGLGKTIEAGLILHHQLITGQAERILILVPDSLVHQWLVEMLRRFNLRFSLFDQARFDAENACDLLDENEINQQAQDNPFESEQAVIVGIDGIMAQPKMHHALLECQWDLLVVDEAHHLHWEESGSSAQYQLVDALSQRSKGLLLLTATPEQAGIDSHFARLRLIDPERFHSLESFKLEMEQYANLSGDVNQLLDPDSDLKLSSKSHDLMCLIQQNHPDIDSQSLRQTVLDQLIDHHGTGRVLFRNARSAMTGFPEREVLPVALPCPEIYRPENDMKLYCGLPGLTPESNQLPEIWISQDPRVEWLEQTINDLKPNKILVIAHFAETALALQEHFSKTLGIRCSCFHEGLSLVERDRSAAYFADREQGAQVLFCSEIGSEGRNFQFAHHLIMFDLPMNPDLLMQRIGRLDRIGQTQTIAIHIPYLLGTSQEVMFHWFDRGLNLFKQNFSAGFSVYEQFEQEITKNLRDPAVVSQPLISKTQARVSELVEQMRAGRDQLLELNSCRQPYANDLVEQVAEAEKMPLLANYFEKIVHYFGVELEDHSVMSWVLHPSDHMRSDYFPGLKQDGNTVTLDRLKALSREDIEFLSWEHPMVSESMEMLIQSEGGNASVSTLSVKGLTPGTLLLESVYLLQSIAPKYLQLHRYLEQAPQRILIDASGNNLSNVVSHQALNGLVKPLKKKVSIEVVKQCKAAVEKLLQLSLHSAQKQTIEIKNNAISNMQQKLTAEKLRLIQLRQTNGNIRQEEIDIIDQQIEHCASHIKKASLQLQAVRLLVAS